MIISRRSGHLDSTMCLEVPEGFSSTFKRNCMSPLSLEFCAESLNRPASTSRINMRHVNRPSQRLPDDRTLAEPRLKCCGSRADTVQEARCSVPNQSPRDSVLLYYKDHMLVTERFKTTRLYTLLQEANGLGVGICRLSLVVSVPSDVADSHLSYSLDWTTNSRYGCARHPISGTGDLPNNHVGNDLCLGEPT